MDELLAKATQGVDLNAPDAYLHIFINLMAMMPWVALFWWNLAFIAVGALLGWWRGRLLAGVIWAAVLGPIGWIIVLRAPKLAKPPPLPR
ncbi:hypothetical protein [Dyella sp. 2HG41-7]|uniref:hypothetical protein n=1 Tax=Dyella sp. 2HG41-7 TaxID=2883239 RepID=UPI001F17340F|nr:hypothetical protein [Dyella sp. 2HG41-7]